jgi:superfamily I DNA/RNA helicase
MSKEKWFIRESELDDNQHKINELNDKYSYCIEGCAGSGKTILALWKAKYHQEIGNNYLFIVYTKALKTFISDGILELGLDSSKVITFYAWGKAGYPTADYIIVDEAQDFTKSEVKLLKDRALVSIMLFGDSVQQLYSQKNQEPTLNITEIAEVLAIPTRKLLKNYRLPKPIARFAQKIPRIKDNLADKCVKETSELPTIFSFPNETFELDYIIEAIKSEIYTDVGIILPRNEDVESVYKYFSKKNILTEAKYNIPEKSYLDTLDFGTTNPKILTYHSCKGLQFETVFLPFCEVTSVFFQNPLYVSATRPYNELFITYSESITPFIKSIPKSLYKMRSYLPLKSDLPF